MHTFIHNKMEGNIYYKIYIIWHVPCPNPPPTPQRTILYIFIFLEKRLNYLVKLSISNFWFLVMVANFYFLSFFYMIHLNYCASNFRLCTFHVQLQNKKNSFKKITFFLVSCPPAHRLMARPLRKYLRLL